MKEMRHKEILDVIVIIHNGKQKVGFKLKDIENICYLTPLQVYEATAIKITEVEILIGSTMRVVFYRKGEELFDGRICNKNNLIVKDFWITLSGTYHGMKEKNKDKIKPYEIIYEVSGWGHIHDLPEDGKIFFYTSYKKGVYIKKTSLASLTKFDPDEFHILLGSYIAPEYFKKGERIWSGDICRKDETVLKSLNLRYSGFGIKELMEKESKVTRENYINSLETRSTYGDLNYNDWGVESAYNALDGQFYDADWIQDVFGLNPDDDIPWGNID